MRATLQKWDAPLDINIKAEIEIESLHQKIDSLRNREIAELRQMLSMQNQTILRLEKMLAREIDSNHPINDAKDTIIPSTDTIETTTGKFKIYD